ncbi:assimilatory nitrate reductase [Sulfurimicrobium lacus]|uniref:nitrate reductase (cytochrome) n=2 Tax=Sulfurimicrobium lacus TaxID=2715678 RepID=A0A6F8VD91_9PROT|nr:nitrate reductase [Sulfurimicrobium lacus]BCB27644.1 assimilatory nitrate reductase [Sulfurimicrobium lacus]
MAETKSICCYCGTGCGVIVTSDGARVTGVRGDPDHPANRGRLCTKGANLHLTVRSDATRVLQPELRPSRGLERRACGWDEALDTAAERFAAVIREHGPDSVAFYVSGQLLTEDYHVFNKLARGLVGTNNIDSNSRLCMSSAVVGYKTTLGSDAPPACYDDIEQAKCIFIAGANPAFAHPILFRRVEAAKKSNPDLKLIVVDPRRTDTAASADLHLAILPGTDVALFNGMLHVLLWDGLADFEFIRAHTEGFDALKATVREYTPKMVAQICGVTEAQVVQAAQWFGQSGATLSLYCQGLNQSTHGTDNNAALINLHLATGQIGKPGAGPLSLTGQPNAMGGREVGAMATLLPGHRDPANVEHRAEVAQLWDVPSLPERPGKTAVEMFEAVRSGEIKAIWIACTNPAQSLPHQQLVREALEQAELVVVQEAFAGTETAAYADILLPAATWPEKEGCMTNSERCIGRVSAAVPPPGKARADWEIAADFARRLGACLGKGDLARRLFYYEHAQQIFDEHRAATRGRDLDMTGLSYAVLESQGPQQWPYPQGAQAGTARLYGDGVFPSSSRRARFADTRYRPAAEQADARYPFTLLTGRLRDQWHGMSRTGLAARLWNHVEAPLLEMHPLDLERRGLKAGALVRIRSRRGELVLPVQACADLRPGQVFLPMHWGSRFLSGQGVNALTTNACDPQSHQPELKHAAVQVEAVDLPWQMVGLRSGDGAEWMEKLRPVLGQFPYVTLGLAGRDMEVMVLRAAATHAPDAAALTALEQLLALEDGTRALSYRDARRGIAKRLLAEEGAITGALLTGETAAAEWLKDGMERGLALSEVRSWALAPLAAPPSGQVSRGKVVCNCFNVSAKEIEAEIAGGAGLVELQEKLKCGTECGSCVPELRRMIEFSGAESCKN